MFKNEGSADQQNITDQQNNLKVNQALKAMFGLSVNPPEAQPVSGAEEMLYGDREPDETGDFQVNERAFGYEIYQPTKEANGVWLVTEHGHCGRARDWAKLAKMANDQGYGLLALEMHKHGRDDYEKMSMKLEEWTIAGQQAPGILNKKGVQPRKLIFLGQSSGGSAGAAIAVEGKQSHPYDGMILIGPTLTNTDPDGVKAMEELVGQNINTDEDVMLDWKWMAPLFAQIKDEKLNQAYAGYLSTLPGFPFRHARDSMVVDDAKILDRLGRIDVPVVVSAGEYDVIDHRSMPQLEERLQRTSNKNVSVQKIEGAGHQAQIEKPELVMSLIDKLLLQI